MAHKFGGPWTQIKLGMLRRYLAAIPLALLSSEGIALRVCNKSLFNAKGNRPEIAGWLAKQNLAGLAKSFLASLSEPHPMSKSSKGESVQLSRHGVLHGRDVSYGSELFSLQAIALLGFVGSAFAAGGLAFDEACAAGDSVCGTEQRDLKAGRESVMRAKKLPLASNFAHCIPSNKQTVPAKHLTGHLHAARRHVSTVTFQKSAQVHVSIITLNFPVCGELGK